jgi:Short repeat of unknown function (DUF308)
MTVATGPHLSLVQPVTPRTLLLGIVWIINGAAELFMALSRQEMRGRAWTGLVGVLSVLAGLIVLVYPPVSLLTLVVVLGIWLPRYLAARARRPADSPGIPSAVGPQPGTTRSQGARDVRRQPCQ